MIKDQKVAIITGGSSGIGFSIAEKLCSNNINVVIIGRTEEKLEEARKKLGKNARWMTADVGKSAEVDSLKRQLTSEYKIIDYLINNAGFVKGVTTEFDLNEAEKAWDQTVDANLKGSFLMSVAFGPYLRRPGGRIINISSIAAYTGGSNAGTLAYSSAKAGVHGLTYALARELSSEGITTNVIAPGLIDHTNFFNGNLTDQKRTKTISETPVGRVGKPEDIAEAVWYLLSENASFVNGEVLNVNGGWLFGR